MKHQLAPGRGGVNGLHERLESHALQPQGMYEAHEVRHRAPEPIQPPDHQHVTWGERRQRGIQPRALYLDARDPLVMEDLRAASGGEGIQLEVELRLLPISMRDRGVCPSLQS